MGSINLKHTGSGSAIALSSDGTSLLLNGTAIGGGGGGADLYAANESSPTAQPSATGTNAIAIGDSALAVGTNSFSGPKSHSSGWSSFAVAIDNNSTTYGAKNSEAIAMGYRSIASGVHSVSIGRDGNASGAYGISLGYDANATGSMALSIGHNNDVTHYQSAALGRLITSTADYQVNIGGSTQDVRISETYTLPKVDGTNGQVLTTDGSGAVTFADAGGSGITTGKAIAMAMVFG